MPNCKVRHKIINLVLGGAIKGTDKEKLGNHRGIPRLCLGLTQVSLAHTQAHTSIKWGVEKLPRVTLYPSPKRINHGI